MADDQTPTTARYPVEQPHDDGWSDWIHPLPGYRMACCDCGLVHRLETRIDAAGQVNIRMRRDDAETQAFRREQGIEVRHD